MVRHAAWATAGHAAGRKHVAAAASASARRHLTHGAAQQAAAEAPTPTERAQEGAKWVMPACEARTRAGCACMPAGGAAAAARAGRAWPLTAGALAAWRMDVAVCVHAAAGWIWPNLWVKSRRVFTL